MASIDRSTALAAVSLSMSVGVALGYSGVASAALEWSDAPSSAFSKYSYGGTTDGWQVYPDGGIWGSKQLWTLTDDEYEGPVDGGFWTFPANHQDEWLGEIQVYISDDGIMTGRAQYFCGGCGTVRLDQAAYSNQWARIYGLSYVGDGVDIQDKATDSPRLGAKVGADGIRSWH